MNTQKYISLLAEPQLMKQEDITSLSEVIEAYPFFQSARSLWLKGLKNAESFKYNDALKVTAAHTTNRDILFEFITSKTFEQHKISQQILINDAAIHELNITISEDISHTVHLEQKEQTTQELKKAEAILNPNLFEKKIEGVKKMIASSNALQKKEPSITKIVEETRQQEELSTITPATESTKEPAQILEINKPIPFSKKDTHSFSEWLQLTTVAPIVRTETKQDAAVKFTQEIAQEEKERKYQLIEKFINAKPKIKPQQEKSIQINLAQAFTKAPDSLMTETLAKVYLQQKNYKKAIQAYKILILKNPEKSGFFADQIRAVEKLINKEES